MSAPADVELDARGRLCPEPVLQLARAARALGEGTIAVLADDLAAETDIPAWCELRSATLVAVEPGAGHTRYVVRIGSTSISASTSTPD